VQNCVAAIDLALTLDFDADFKDISMSARRCWLPFLGRVRPVKATPTGLTMAYEG